MSFKAGLASVVAAPIAIGGIVVTLAAWATVQVAKAVENMADVEAWDDDLW